VRYFIRWLGIAALSVWLGLSAPASAEVVIAISKSQQSMTVSINGAPMPNSVFFYGGYAIHGTYEEAKLGSPVSHGCVRLTRANAATLYALVGAQGLRNTQVLITDGPERELPMASERRPVLQVADRDGRDVERRQESRYDPRGEPRYSPRRDLRDDPRLRPRRELQAEPRHDLRDERRYRPRPTRYDPRLDRRDAPRYRPGPVRDEPRYEPRYEVSHEPPPRGRLELLCEYECNARRQAEIERALAAAT
jgi:hypothetical protein